jgi:hypothetical protein
VLVGHESLVLLVHIRWVDDVGKFGLNLGRRASLDRATNTADTFSSSQSSASKEIDRPDRMNSFRTPP